ncbi:MAG: CHAT domain-containing protein [Elusimicrobia bacterium]|nr:CHAT domain-containing protein [Elusimicrobiota bacterium]
MPTTSVKRAVMLLSAVLPLLAVLSRAAEDDIRIFNMPGRQVDPRIFDLQQEILKSYAKGDLAAAVRFSEEGLVLAEKSEDPAVIESFLGKVAFYNHERGRKELALEYYGRALTLQRKMVFNIWTVGGDTVMEAYIYMCPFLRKLGHAAEAAQCEKEWKEVQGEREALLSGKAEANPDDLTAVATAPAAQEQTTAAAEKAESSGEFDKAVGLYAEALQALPPRESGPRADLLRRQGIALGRAGRAREAGETFAKAGALFASDSDLGDEANCLERAAAQEKKAGAYASAAAHEARALWLAPRVALARRHADAAVAEGDKARSERRDADTLKAYQKALSLARTAGLQGPGEAGLLVNMASAMLFQGNYEGALEHAERALKLPGETGAAKGWALYGEAAALQGLGRFHEAIHRYEDAWRFFLRQGNEEAEMRVLWGFGSFWGAINDGRQEILCFNRAIRIAEKLKNYKSVDALRLNIAAMLERLNNPDVTERAWKARLESSRRTRYEPGIADSLWRLGDTAASRGHYQQSLGFYRESLELQRKTGNKQNELVVLLQYAGAQRLTGDPSAGLKTLDQALRLAQSMGNRDNQIPVLASIATERMYLGDFPAALRSANECLALAKQLGSPGRVAGAEITLGLVYDHIGDYEESLRHYKLAMPEVEKSKDAAQMIGLLGNFGEAYLDMGDWKNAVAYNERMLNLNNWGGGVINIGYSYFDGKQYGKAAEKFNQVGHKLGLAHIDLIRKRHAEALKTWQSLLPEAEKEGDYTVLIALRSGIGLAQEGLGRYADAAASYHEGEKLLERVRDGLSESGRIHFLATSDWSFPRIEPHEGMVRALPFLKEGLRGSLYAAEFTRARVFAEAAARLYGTPQTRLPQGLAEREQRLIDSIAAAVRRSDGAFRANDKTGFAAAERELAGLKKEQEKLVADLRRQFPEYASALYPRPVHAEEIGLAPDETLIEFEVTEPYTKAFVVRDGKVVSSYDVRLTRDELSELVRKYRGYFEGVQDSAGLAAYDPKLGHKLYQLLLEPAVKSIPPGSRLIVVPDEILGILPFESLVVSLPRKLQSPSGRHGPVPAGVRYAADEYDIAYAQSATALTELRAFSKRGATPREALIVADPIFNTSDSRLRGTPLAKAALDPQAIRTMGAVGRTMGVGGSRYSLTEEKVKGDESFVFPRLDKTSVLAEGLAQFFGSQADELIGPQASEAELSKMDLSQYRNVVFATHGILDGTVSGIGEPALVLNQLGNEPPQNGFLTMSKIMGLRLNADVVALTACDTGLGQRLTGEGVMGLGRAFQYAGARNVLVSLWNVAEDSTTLFAERFFQYLHEGKTKREALRLARADLRREGYEHPFYWAPFILFGD